MNRYHKLVPVAVDVLQVYSETKVGSITLTNLGVSLFPYGFTLVNRNNGSRTLSPNPANGQYDGILTFAFKIPLQTSAKKDPWHLVYIFKPIVQTNTRITQAPEEQSKKGDEILADHINNDIGLSNVDSIIVFPGSDLWQFASKTELKCSNVRVAGTPAGHIITPLLTPTQHNQVGRYPDSASTGAEVTIHGCNLTGATVTVGNGINATVVSSDDTHVVFNVPAVPALGQNYPVDVTRKGSSTPTPAGQLYVTSAIIGPNATAYKGANGICALCSVSNLNNIVDTDPTSFANMNVTVGLGASIWVGVKYNGSAISAGGRAGFVIKTGGGLLDVSALSNIVITTYDANGNVLEQKSGSSVLNVDLLAGNSHKQFVSFKTTQPFNDIRLTFPDYLV